MKELPDGWYRDKNGKTRRGYKKQCISHEEREKVINYFTTNRNNTVAATSEATGIAKPRVVKIIDAYLEGKKSRVMYKP